jgi:hypothetical protein
MRLPLPYIPAANSHQNPDSNFLFSKSRGSNAKRSSYQALSAFSFSRFGLRPARSGRLLGNLLSPFRRKSAPTSLAALSSQGYSVRVLILSSRHATPTLYRPLGEINNGLTLLSAMHILTAKHNKGGEIHDGNDRFLESEIEICAS